MIIDVHVHLGHDVVFDLTFTEPDLLGARDTYGVDMGIVQPFVVPPLPEPQRVIHDEIYALTQRFPGRFVGMASLNPHCGEGFYRSEMKRCIKQLGFVGLKLHPVAHAANPSSCDGRMAFEVARELRVPLMIHTGGSNFAAPTNLFYLAREFKDVALVMAHAGGTAFSDAVLVARENDNVYMDMSWCPARWCQRFVQQLGASRLMLASDHPSNVPVELDKWRTLGLTSSDLEWVLGRTAAQVYGLNWND